jgi:hypothetical protein
MNNKIINKKNMKTITKKIIGTVLLLLITTSLNAQVTIGSLSEPNESAVLDLNTGGPGNLGLLLPSIDLESDTDQETIDSPAIGLMVYASGNGGLSAGIYVWDGTQWQTSSATPGTEPEPDTCSGLRGSDGKCYRHSAEKGSYAAKPSCGIGWTCATRSDLSTHVTANDWYAVYGNEEHWVQCGTNGAYRDRSTGSAWVESYGTSGDYVQVCMQ